MFITNEFEWAGYVESIGAARQSIIRQNGLSNEVLDIFPSYPAIVVTTLDICNTDDGDNETRATHYVIEIEDAERLIKLAQIGVKHFE